MSRAEYQPQPSKEQVLEKYPFSKHLFSNKNNDEEWGNKFRRLFTDTENVVSSRLGSNWERVTISTIGLMVNDQGLFVSKHDPEQRSQVVKILFLAGYEMGDDSDLFIEDVLKKGEEYNFLNTELTASSEGQEKLGGIIKNIFDVANYYRGLDSTPFREADNNSPLFSAVVSQINSMRAIDKL